MALDLHPLFEDGLSCATYMLTYCCYLLEGITLPAVLREARIVHGARAAGRERHVQLKHMHLFRRSVGA